MAYIGKKPWHGSGKELPVAQPIETWLRAAQLNWELKRLPETTATVVQRRGTGSQGWVRHDKLHPAGNRNEGSGYAPIPRYAMIDAKHLSSDLDLIASAAVPHLSGLFG